MPERKASLPSKAVAVARDLGQQLDPMAKYRSYRTSHRGFRRPATDTRNVELRLGKKTTERRLPGWLQGLTDSEPGTGRKGVVFSY